MLFESLRIKESKRTTQIWKILKFNWEGGIGIRKIQRKNSRVRRINQVIFEKAWTTKTKNPHDLRKIGITQLKRLARVIITPAEG
jgi:hypothetical protein